MIILKDVSETRKWASEFAKTLRAPCVVALHGDLGMGKSEIARAIIQALCGSDTVVPSPTFTLVQSYECGIWNSEFGINNSKNKKNNAKIEEKTILHSIFHVSHFDLYRLTDPSELTEIGLAHACANDITLIEWPEIATDMLPKDTIHIYIIQEGEGRKLEVKIEDA